MPREPPARPASRGRCAVSSDVVQQLEWFNEASQLYNGYCRPAQLRTSKTNFVPQIYFIRQVADEAGARSGFINVLNEKISLPAAYINYFVLARWDLSQERLEIYFEKELKPKRIKQIKFAINKNVTYQKGSFSFGH